MQAIRNARRPLAIIALVATSGAAGAIACSSFSEDAGTSPSDEAGTGSPEAGDGDGGPDATKSDAAFCANSDASFCVDFDDGDLVSHWTSFSDAGASTVSLDPNVALSGKYSLHVTSDGRDPNLASPCAYARAYRRLASLGPQNEVSFSFDVRLGTRKDMTGIDFPKGLASINATDDAGANICSYIIALGERGCTMRLEHKVDGGIVALGTPAVFETELPQRWSHLEMRVSMAPSGTMRFLIDGKDCNTPIPLPDDCRVPSLLDIYPGLYCVGKDEGWVEANIDNVEVRAAH